MHELLIDICTGFYSTVALFFELALVLGCLCCILEVCLKCSRRERKEYYNVEQKLRRRRKKRTTAAGDEVSESDSDSDSEIESASSESDDEEPPNEGDAKEWTAFNARRKKRASDKIKRQKKRLKNAERRLKKREIRAEQKEKALQKAEKARIAADKAQLNITDKLEKHDITTRHNDAAKAEKVGGFGGCVGRFGSRWPRSTANCAMLQLVLLGRPPARTATRAACTAPPCDFH